MKAGTEAFILEFQEASLTGPTSVRPFLAATRAAGFQMAGEFAVDDYLDSTCGDLGEFNETLQSSPHLITRRVRLAYATTKVPFINPRSGPEAIDVNEFRKRWEDPEWIKANADHPIAYLWALFVQLQVVNKALAMRKPRIKLVRGGRECYVPQDGDVAKVEELLGYFKNGWTRGSEEQ